MTSVLAASLIAFFALPSHGQEAEPRRVLAVSVIDRDGHPVSGLTAANFRGTFRGQPVRILSAVLDTSPRRIAVIVDTSASMRREWAFAWAAAEDLALAMVPKHRVVILTLGGANLEQLSGLSSDPSVLQQALHSGHAQKPAGTSFLYDGHVMASRAFSGAGLGDVIYLVTDGEDTASTATWDAVRIAAIGRGVRVFVVLVNLEPLAQGRAAFWVAEREMGGLTEATGGFLFHAKQQQTAEAAQRLRLCSALITEVYRIEVTLPRLVDKPRNWSLEVTDANGKKLSNVELAYPRLLVPSSD